MGMLRSLFIRYCPLASIVWVHLVKEDARSNFFGLHFDEWLHYNLNNDIGPHGVKGGQKFGPHLVILCGIGGINRSMRVILCNLSSHIFIFYSIVLIMAMWEG